MFPNKFEVLTLIILCHIKYIFPDDCDSGRNQWFREGNQGQVGIFPWIGVIRIHIHEGTKMKIALTGVVLIRQKYAIAVAKDIANIPRRLLLEDSKAMFIPVEGEPWFCKLKDFLVHPEYEYSTLNTIAIIELAFGDDQRVSLPPICWPTYLYNTSNQLYAVGYTDENQLLEKIAYKVEYVDKSLCEEFYNRAGVQDKYFIPTYYQCGFAPSNTKHCEWENGMVLASNTTGLWVLIGFGIRGPGCAAPARFIDLYQYVPWIEMSITNSDDAVDYPQKNYFQSVWAFRRLAPNQTSNDFNLTSEEVKTKILRIHGYSLNNNTSENV